MFNFLNKSHGKETVQLHAEPTKSGSYGWNNDDESGETQVVPAVPPAVAVATNVSAAPAPTQTASDPAALPEAFLPANDADLDEVIPDTHAACLVLLRKVQKLADRNDWQWRAKRDAKVEAIVWRIHGLANTPVSAGRSQLAKRPQAMIEKVRVACASEIAALKVKDLEFHNLRVHLTAEGMLPNEADALIKQIEIAIGSAPDSQTVAKLVARKAHLVEILKTPSVGRNAVRLLNLKLAAMAPEVNALDAAIEAALKTLDSELVKAETEFFADYGLAHQRTQVSNIAEQVRNHLKETTAAYHRTIAQQDNFPTDRLLTFCKSAFAALYGDGAVK